MKNQKTWLALSLIFLCLLSAPDSIFAYACCAEPGTYRISTRKPDNYQLDLLGKMKFDNAEDFTHWRVEINGKKAAYAFYGELTPRQQNN